MYTELMVLKSNAGYYVGRLSDEGFPYSRDSEYFGTKEDAQITLDLMQQIEGYEIELDQINDDMDFYFDKGIMDEKVLALFERRQIVHDLLTDAFCKLNA